jgi:hypothetical protein
MQRVRLSIANKDIQHSDKIAVYDHAAVQRRLLCCQSVSSPIPQTCTTPHVKVPTCVLHIHVVPAGLEVELLRRGLAAVAIELHHAHAVLPTGVVRLAPDALAAPACYVDTGRVTAAKCIVEKHATGI